MTDIDPATSHLISMAPQNKHCTSTEREVENKLHFNINQMLYILHNIFYSESVHYALTTALSVSTIGDDVSIAVTKVCLN